MALHSNDQEIPQEGLKALQGAFNCVILESGIGGRRDPRRKWEGERGREREREKEKKSVAFVCKMI